ncbi:chromosomal replication initiator DnaA [Sphingomonas sp. CFBP 13720]|uniref:chromosomal replication initiator DnaA n=1 Tax=Sphingomonas sp. CFBP 13720 TaxID=2775302 RepID=UPI00178290E4|nr:chromosomal replication initiator DnaA [Sphingomonas sp. CFBP 13720]MBD8676919.1 chromosomal replication initiator DnaA [Sphingomonas sp. CFBP 13720]
MTILPRGSAQLSLPLEFPPGAREDLFLVSPSNADAVHHLDHWSTWPVKAALLVGPRKSGRTLLARMFAGRSGGTIADDAERWSETDLFHAWNRAQSDGRPLLIVADAPPPDWRIGLPDLRSRIGATPLLRIAAPDDGLMDTLLQYLFDRKELMPAPDLVRWLARRVERSHLSVLRVVEALEEDAMLRSTRRLTVPAARIALAGTPLIVEHAA